MCFLSTDNHTVHHVQEVIERVYDYGAIIRFLPPYPPDLNLIEDVLASVKHYLRQNHLVLHSFQDPSLLLSGMHTDKLRPMAVWDTCIMLATFDYLKYF